MQEEKQKGISNFLNLKVESREKVDEIVGDFVAIQVYRELQTLQRSYVSNASCNIIGNCSGGGSCDIIGNCSSSSHSSFAGKTK